MEVADAAIGTSRSMGNRRPTAAWYYPSPKDGAEAVAGHVLPGGQRRFLRVTRVGPVPPAALRLLEVRVAELVAAIGERRRLEHVGWCRATPV